jgi:hypothetical protein
MASLATFQAARAADRGITEHLRVQPISLQEPARVDPSNAHRSDKTDAGWGYLCTEVPDHPFLVGNMVPDSFEETVPNTVELNTDPPIEANPDRENAPNEANSSAHALSSTFRDGHKEFRIDTPHVDRKTGGFGITGKQKMHPALHRALTGRESALLDMSAIFGKQSVGGF